MKYIEIDKVVNQEMMVLCYMKDVVFITYDNCTNFQVAWNRFHKVSTVLCLQHISNEAKI